MYNLTKEIIDATRTFPFQNPEPRQLALDSQLRNSAQSLRKASSWGKRGTERAYLASKRRCHFGLMDFRQRAFGIREEYRISWALFHSLMAVLHSLGRVNLSTRSIGRRPPTSMYGWSAPLTLSISSGITLTSLLQGSSWFELDVLLCRPRGSRRK